MVSFTVQGLKDKVLYTKPSQPPDAAPKTVETGVYKDTGEFALPTDIVLYVTVLYSQDVALAKIDPAAPPAPSWFYHDAAEIKAVAWNNDNPVLASSTTYLAPYAADVLQYKDIVSVATRTPKALETSSTSSTSSSGSSSASLSDSGPQPLNTNDPAVIEFASNASTAAAAAASVSALVGTMRKNEATGAAVGGSIGGLIVGIVIALIALVCLRRRRHHGSGKHPHRSRPSDEDTDTRGYPMSKEMQGFAPTTTVTGWQKHLPQDKDDGTITKTVKTIFDQIHMHVEGFYNSKPRKVTDSAVAALERVSPDGLSRKLSKAPDSLPILEGILIRWIVHRISLRSDVGDSLLPSEYTKIPKQNNWHMESEEGNVGQIGEPKKGQSSLSKIFLHNLTDLGFPQAFSQWRVLTVFLHPDPRADQASKKQLDVKIDQGVRALADAFAPWDIPGRSITTRNESLRRILQLASDAGLMLFAQPSTFVFDWSSRQGTVTVTPALVKKLDEAAEPLASPVVLIAAKRVNA
jgi:hypothetical protein